VTIGTRRPGNFRHFLLNNGAHESVGGQPTGAFPIDFPVIARAAGYPWARRADSAAELQTMLPELRAGPGPAFLEVRVRSGSRPDLGRPTATPGHNRDVFMEHLIPTLTDRNPL
jgi:phosphonopyruvate decarboxylase